MSSRIVLCIALGALGAACSNKLSGSVEVNGESLSIESCHNGVVYGFRGVELVATNGLRLRVAMMPSGEAVAFVIPRGAEVGKQITGTCGSLQVEDQNSTVNDVKNVEGTAKLDCAADGFTVKGTIKFENCH
jgi:hypothetical protein